MNASAAARSAQEYLTERDLEWSQQLKAVSLAAEIHVSESDLTQTLGLLGHRYRELWSHSENGAREVLRRWPAVLVMSMVQAATDHYEHGNFWGPFCSRTGLASSGELQRTWGSAFVENLSRIGLPTFDEMSDVGSRYVGRVLMHAGMPTYCLSDYFLLIAEHRRTNYDMTATSFVADAARDAERDRLDVDKPVARFLRYGGEYAVDVAERSLDLIDDLLSGGDGTRALLPKRFAMVAKKLVEQQAFDALRGRRRTGKQEERQASPGLVLDPHGRGVLVRLPAISDTPDGVATWQVTIDGRRELVRSQALWPGNDEPAPATDHPVARPSRAALVQLGQHENAPLSIVPIVDESDPILFFAADGQRLPSSMPLPSNMVWVLYPTDAISDPLTYVGNERVVASGRMPTGWSGWRIDLVDLADVRGITLTVSGTEHVVRGTQSARVTTGRPIDGLRTPYGTAVYSEAPEVQLPTSGPDVMWEVSIADGNGQVLIRESVSSAHSTLDPWANVPRPLLGSYQIQVRGPWGRGTSRNVVLAEGLALDHRPAWRRFGRGGLVPAEVDIRPRSALSVDRRTIAFGPSVRSEPIVASRSGSSETFVLTPPHMTVSYETRTSIGRESTRPAPLESESLIEDPGVLLVQLGEDFEPILHVMCAGAVTQLVPPAARATGGVYRFELARIVETIRDHRAAILSLDPAGDVAVAVVRPHRLAADGSVVDGELVLSGARDIGGLTAAVYLLCAPWRRPLTLRVVDGRAALPPEYHLAGSMLVTLYIDDPWVPISPATWPAIADTILVDRPGSFDAGENAESSLSAYLAADVEPPTNADLAHVWVVLERVDELGLQARREQLRAFCGRTLQLQPEDSLIALDRAALPAASAASALIASGVVARARGRNAATVQWSSSPVAAALLLGERIESLNATEVNAALDFLGSSANALLAGLPDPFRKAGCFDESADFVAQMNAAALAAFRSAVAFVPKAYLDADSRSDAAMKLVEHRGEPRAKPLRRVSGKLLADALALLRQLDDKRFYWAVRARTHPRVENDWQALSALSLAFALLARLAAHDHARMRVWLDAQTSYWAVLASLAPELTNIDLVLAQLLYVGSTTTPGSIEQPPSDGQERE